MTDDLDTAVEQDELSDDADLEESDDELAGEDDGDADGNRVEGGLSRQVLEFLARSIVDDPDGVVVEADRNRNSVNLELHVAPGDMGRVIGRRGRVAQAIRAVVRAAGAREGVNAQVDIVD